ncbi:cation transporter, partial [Shigella sonnei]|nr:cation transporter [Shigella sonnei]
KHTTSDEHYYLLAGVTAGVMLVEVVGGFVSGSLALLADAGHMLTDTAALPENQKAYNKRRALLSSGRCDCRVYAGRSR